MIWQPIAWTAVPLKVCNLTALAIVLIPQAVTKWSKRPVKGDRERNVQSTNFTHFWPFTLQGCWVPLGSGRSVFILPTKLPLRLPSVITSHQKTTKQGTTLAHDQFHSSFMLLSHTQVHCRVSEIQQKTSSKYPYLVLKIPDEPPIWKFAAASHMLCWDLWPLEKRNSIQGQRQGLTTWGFLCSSFVKVS